MLFLEDHSTKSIKVNSISSAYRNALKTIIYNGTNFNDERGDKMRVFYNLSITISNPLENLEELEEMNKKGSIPYNREFLDNYANQLIYGTSNPKFKEVKYTLSKNGLLYRILNHIDFLKKWLSNSSLINKIILVQDVRPLPDEDLGFVYTYFERLRKRWSRLAKVTFQSFENDKIVDSEKMDQIEEVIRLLIKSPMTRRAVATTRIPSVDLRSSEVPCLNWLKFYNTGVLNLSVVFRSHDIFGAYISNLYGLSRLLEYVSIRTGIEMGSLTIFSADAHYNTLFEKDVFRIVEDA